MITPLPFSPLITILDPPYSSILCHPSVSCVTHPTPLLRLKTSTLNFSKPSFPLSQFICPPVKGCLVPCRFPPSLSYSSHPCGGEVWSMALGFHVAKQAVSTSICLTPPPPPPHPLLICVDLLRPPCTILPSWASISWDYVFVLGVIRPTLFIILSLG